MELDWWLSSPSCLHFYAFSRNKKELIKFTKPTYFHPRNAELLSEMNLEPPQEAAKADEHKNLELPPATTAKATEQTKKKTKKKTSNKKKKK